MINRTQIASLLTIFVASSFYAAPAHAYLDPGTGSILLQGLIASIAGMLVAGRLYWQRVKLFFAGVFGKTSDDSNLTDSDVDSPTDTDKLK